MKFIDMTLRDGDIVELGCWKQTGKFDGPFYSIGEQLLATVYQISNKKLSLMVEYHYCSHAIEDYPSNVHFLKLGLIESACVSRMLETGVGLQKSLRNIRIVS